MSVLFDNSPCEEGIYAVFEQVGEDTWEQYTHWLSLETALQMKKDYAKRTSNRLVIYKSIYIPDIEELCDTK